MTEHTVALLLVLSRKIAILEKNIKNNRWDYTIAKPVFRIEGGTLELVGFDNIAGNVASRAQGSGMKVLAL